MIDEEKDKCLQALEFSNSGDAYFYMDIQFFNESGFIEL